MSIRWKSFAGDTAAFAVEISFETDPHGGVGSTREESASWGAFKLWAGGRLLTAHSEFGENVSAVHWYLLPLIEWWVDNWDPIFHEQRLPNGNRGDDAAESLHATRFPPPGQDEGSEEEWEREWQEWWNRHNLRSARSGGLMPDLQLRRWGDEVELSWTDSPVEGSPRDVAFVEARGRERSPIRDVCLPLFEALAESASYLSDALPDSERLGALLLRVEDLRRHDRLVRRCGWLSGLSGLADTLEGTWERLERKAAGSSETVRNAIFGTIADDLMIVRAPTAAQMFGSVSPTVSEHDVGRIMEFLLESVSGSEESPELLALVRDEPLDVHRSPAEQGYLLAEELTEELRLDEDDWVDIRKVLSHLGIEVAEIELSDSGIRGLSVAGEGMRAVIALNSSYPWSDETVRRFTLAHEFCHILFDRGLAQRIAIASGPWAPRDIERRAGAFAAMLLLPEKLLSAAIKREGQPTSWAIVKSLAAQLKVSPSAMLEHLRARNYVDPLDYERLKDESMRRRIQGK